MKNNQNGFVIPIIILIVVLLVIGGGIYFYSNKIISNEVIIKTNISDLRKVAEIVFDHFDSYTPLCKDGLLNYSNTYVKSALGKIQSSLNNENQSDFDLRCFSSSVAYVISISIKSQQTTKRANYCISSAGYIGEGIVDGLADGDGLAFGKSPLCSLEGSFKKMESSSSTTKTNIVPDKEVEPIGDQKIGSLTWLPTLPNKMNQYDAIIACAATGSRLPTRNELIDALSAQFIIKPQSMTGFMVFTDYWSSTEFVDTSTNYQQVWITYYDSDDNNVGRVIAGKDYTDGRVRCVR